MWRVEGWVWPAAAPSAGPQFTSRLPAPHAGRLTLAQDTRGTDGCKKLMRIEHERRAKTPKSHCTHTQKSGVSGAAHLQERAKWSVVLCARQVSAEPSLTAGEEARHNEAITPGRHTGTPCRQDKTQASASYLTTQLSSGERVQQRRLPAPPWECSPLFIVSSNFVQLTAATPCS